MKVKACFAWRPMYTHIDLVVRGKRQAHFVISFPALSGFLLPGGTYLEIRERETQEVEVPIDLDLDQFMINGQLSRKVIEMIPGLSLFGRANSPWIEVFDHFEVYNSLSFRANFFRVTVQDRGMTTEDLVTLSKVLALPRRLLIAVQVKTMKALDYYPVMLERRDKEKAKRNLLRLLLGQVPPILECREIFAKTVIRVPDYQAALVEEVNRLLDLAEGTGR